MILHSLVESLNKQVDEANSERGILVDLNESLREDQSRSDIISFELKSSLIAKEKEILIIEDKLKTVKLKMNEEEANREEALAKELSQGTLENLTADRNQMKERMAGVREQQQ